MADRLPFLVTFGRAHVPHPTFPAADADGWVTVWAGSYVEARRAAHEALGNAWAWIYTPQEVESGRFDPSFFPAGETGVIGVPPEDGPLRRLVDDARRVER